VDFFKTELQNFVRFLLVQNQPEIVPGFALLLGLFPPALFTQILLLAAV
jgi:hypothetical protein